MKRKKSEGVIPRGGVDWGLGREVTEDKLADIVEVTEKKSEPEAVTSAQETSSPTKPLTPLEEIEFAESAYLDTIKRVCPDNRSRTLAVAKHKVIADFCRASIAEGPVRPPTGH